MGTGSESKRRNTPEEALRLADNDDYSLVLPAAFLAAHLAFMISENLFLAAGEYLLFGFSSDTGASMAFLPTRFATPARMFARPSGLSFLRFRFAGFAAGANSGALSALAILFLLFRLPFFGLTGASMGAGAGTSLPRSSFSCSCSASSFSLRSAAFRSCCGDTLVMSISAQCGWNRGKVKLLVQIWEINLLSAL